MNAPEPKNPMLGFQGAVLMSMFGNTDVSAVTASNVSMFVLFGSFRQSNQMTWVTPSGSTVIHGKNWSCGAGPPAGSMATYRMSDQVAPWSRLCV
jgi:hypothetical protein